MDKYLGQEIENLAERERFLKDNADTVESISYDKPMKPHEIEKLKEELAEASIKKADAEEQMVEAAQPFKDTIKQQKKVIADAVEKIKRKSEYVTEVCYKMIDPEKRQVGYYNKEGMLVYQRSARQDELQPRLFPLGNQRTGTEG